MSNERKGFNFYKSYFDVYHELSDKEKVEFMDALLERQFWGVEPDKLTGMSKFAYISQRHNIDAQVKGYEDKTNRALHPPTEGGSVGAKTPPPVQVQVEEEGKEEGKGEDPAPIQFNFKQSLLTYGFKKELVTEWIKVRKKKRLTDSEVAYNSFIKVIEKASAVDKNTILEKCVEKSWGGLEYDWLVNAGMIKTVAKPFKYEY